MEEVEEANRAAVLSCHRVISLLVQSREQLLPYRTLMMETREAVSKFKRVVSMLSSSEGHGHARVRKTNRTHSPFIHKIFLDNQPTPRAPMPLQLNPRNLAEKPIKEPDSRNPLLLLQLQLDSSKTALHHQSIQRRQLQQQMKIHGEMHGRSNSNGVNLNFDSYSNATASSTRSFVSSLSLDGSVANLDGKLFNLIGGPQFSDPMNQHSHNKRMCYGRGEDGSGKCATSGRCHCSKKRKLRVKRSIKVPAISNKLADIPPDEYSWRKYGQKPIKGSPHPRGYYKCSSMRGCPARKHVERCLDDSEMLAVTYENEHNHGRMPTQSTLII